MISKPAALGFRVHSGWATAIVLAGPVDAPTVVFRERLELANAAFPGSHEPFHFVELMSMSEASAIIARCWKQSFELAVDAVANTKQAVAQKGFRVTTCAILQGRITEMPDLEKILAAHPNFYQMAFTATGILFREVLMIAAEASDIRVIRPFEWNLEEKAPDLLGLAPWDLSDRLTQMGEPWGSPWTIDQKYAACAAWVALMKRV